MFDGGAAAVSVASKGKDAQRRVWRRFLPFGVVLTGLAIGYVMGWHQFLTLEYLAHSRDMLRMHVSAMPVLSAVLFMLLYAFAVAFSFPAASILTIFAGFLFGWLQGGVMVAFAATAGATAIFLAARSAFGDFLREKVGGRVKKLADGFEKDAFGYLLVLRLAPIFPFFLMNIAPALFKVPLRSYVAATFFGILPGVFAYSYLGQGIDSVIESAKTAGREAAVSDLVTPQITAAFVILAVVAALPVVIRRLRARN
jgi:uncharacterized membrane protein YdjX (TVP38/TMEM64 family)